MLSLMDIQVRPPPVKSISGVSHAVRRESTKLLRVARLGNRGDWEFEGEAASRADPATGSSCRFAPTDKISVFPTPATHEHRKVLGDGRFPYATKSILVSASSIHPGMDVSMGTASSEISDFHLLTN